MKYPWKINSKLKWIDLERMEKVHLIISIDNGNSGNLREREREKEPKRI